MKLSAEIMRQFYQDLASMLDLSTSPVTALKLISENSESSALATSCQQIADELMSGADFADALSEFPEIFPKRVVGMFRLGEQQGLLAEQFGLIAEGYQKQFLGNESDSVYNDLALVFAEIALLINYPAPAYSLAEAFKYCGRIYDGWFSNNFVDSFYLVSRSLRDGDSLWNSLRPQLHFYPHPVKVLFEPGGQTPNHLEQAFFADLSRLLYEGLIPGLRDDLPPRDMSLYILLRQFFESLKFLLNFGSSLPQALDYISEDHPDAAFGYCLESVSRSIKAGYSLKQSIEPHAEYFSPIVCHLINQAELHGDMIKTLSAIIDSITRGSILARP